MTTITTLLQDTKYTKKAILEKLICHVLSLDKTQLFLDADHTIPEEKVERIHQAYTRYTQQQEPLEYIIGSVRFS